MGQQLGFCLLGRTRTARRRLWRALNTVVLSELVRAEIDAAPDHYLAILTELSYAPSLPRVQVALRRLVVVPRTMIAARAIAGLTAKLMTVPAFAGLDEGLRTFFCHRLVWEIDDAIRRAKPSTRHAVHAPESWACVALDQRFVWVDPLWSGRDWLGHVMMFEMPAEPLARRERRDIQAAMERLENSLPTMSAVQRDGTVRSAIAAMKPIQV